MEINKLVDLNNLRTAPKLSDWQAKNLLASKKSFRGIRSEYFKCRLDNNRCNGTK